MYYKPLKKKMKKQSKKIIAIVIAIAMALMAVPSFAAETEDSFKEKVVVSNTGTTKTPVFVDGEVTYFCLQRDVKAPGADGVEYTIADSTEYSDIVEQIDSVLVNYYYHGIGSETIAGFAIWGILEDEVDNYRTLTKLRYGEDAAAEFDALMVQPEGRYVCNFAIYIAEGYQMMITANVEKEETVMMPPPETTTETTTEPTTEEVVESTTEPTTESTTESTTEEPVESTTEEVVETTTETTTEETVIVENEEEPSGPSIVSVPNTGTENKLPTTAIVLLVLSATILLGCGVEGLYKRRKFSLV